MRDRPKAGLTGWKLCYSAAGIGLRQHSKAAGQAPMHRTPKIASLLLAFTLVAVLAGQETQNPSFRTESNLVLVPTLVRGEDAKPVWGLHASDFVVEDDGVAQTVHLDETADPGPVSIVVAVQNGRTAEDEFKRIRTFSTMLQPALNSGAEIAVVTFDSQVKLVQNFTHNTALVRNSLAILQPGDNGAAILDAIHFSINLLYRAPKDSQRVLLLVSETRDHGSHTDLDAVIASIGVSNTVVYALAFSPTMSNILDTMKGNNEDKMEAPNLAAAAIKLLVLARQAMRKNVPKATASLTGGEYELFKSQKSFESHLTDFTNHLYSRYLLSFVPQNPHPGLHQIRVRLRGDDDAKVMGRTSYWARVPVQ
ncbi:MAG TPA: VWA domain-containing protein [Candidatus Acidoferrales bacterium]|nr:VWA domain-containing protein [Candidatus Acidoferrales bacterium]